MKIEQFITDYKEGKIKNLKDALEVKDYMPFTAKFILCDDVLSACNDIDMRTGIVNVDSVSRRVTFTTNIISMYTNLEFSPDANIDGYDMLCENKLIKPILELFADEYVECETMLETMQNDLIANNNTLHNVVGNVAKTLLNIVEPLSNIFKDKMNSLNLDLSQDNIDKYAKLFEGLNK